MPRVRRDVLPSGALHEKYASAGDYVDCYVTTIDGRVGLEDFVAAFYTTWLFKLERWILAWSVRKPSSDEDARAIARGERHAFAAWTEEARTADQLLMCDFLGHTRSWFSARPAAGQTALYFGSVVTARVDRVTGKRRLRAEHRVLLGFHRLYSRALLATARRRLERLQRSPVRER